MPEWKEWQYQLGVATHAYNAKNGALLEIVERMEHDEITTESLEHEMSQEESEWMKRLQSEMFSVLSLLAKGEANQLVRSCEDKTGHAAWRDVIRPKEIKDMREAGKGH